MLLALGKICVASLTPNLIGSFDEKKASKAFEGYYLEQARRYYDQMVGDFKPRMSKAEKDLFCQMVYDHYKEGSMNQSISMSRSD